MTPIPQSKRTSGLLTHDLRHHGAAAGTLSEECDARRVASERSDVPVDPLESRVLIPQAIVALGSTLLGGKEAWNADWLQLSYVMEFLSLPQFREFRTFEYRT